MARHFGGPLCDCCALSFIEIEATAGGARYWRGSLLGRGVTPWIAQPPGPVGGPTGPQVIGLNGAGGSRFTSVRTFRLCALTSATFPAARRPTGSTFP